MWLVGLSCLVALGQLQTDPALNFAEESERAVILGTIPTTAEMQLDESFPSLDSWDFSPPLPATWASVAYLPKINSSGLEVSSFELRHTLLLGYDDYPALNIAPGIGVHGWSGPEVIDLPSRVYDFYLDLSWEPWTSDRSNISIGLTPGLYGDFQRFDKSTAQLTGWLIGSRRLGTQFTLLGGGAYVRQLRSSWLPIGGALWTPNDKTRMELLFPKPKVSRRLVSNTTGFQWVYLAGQFGGGAWGVTDTMDSNVLVGYSDLRLLVGWEGGTWSGKEWHAELGYIFSRNISVNNVSLYAPSDTFIAQWTTGF